MSAIPDSTLAASEQLIADLQRQLAEFRAERDEALQRETATAEVLQLINSSPADLAQVFDAILEKAHSLCGAEHGQLYLYDGELLHPGAVRGEVADVLRQPWKPGPDNLSSRLIAGDAFVQVADTGRLNDPISQAASQLTGMRTVLLVPLRKDGVYLGHIVSARKEVRPFSDKQIALLRAGTVTSDTSCRTDFDTRVTPFRSGRASRTLKPLDTPLTMPALTKAHMRSASSLTPAGAKFTVPCSTVPTVWILDIVPTGLVLS